MFIVVNLVMYNELYFTLLFYYFIILYIFLSFIFLLFLSCCLAFISSHIIFDCFSFPGNGIANGVYRQR